MTPSRPKNGRLAVVVGLCTVGLILMPMARTQALASPDLHPLGRPAAVNLRLDHATATRLLSAVEGAAQENDADSPRSMEAQAAPKAAVVKKAPPPEDHLAFLKDWPFWVIVGGVVVAAAGGYMLFRNSNQKAPCDMTTFNSGCFGSR